jgi:hypothetical protein
MMATTITSTSLELPGCEQPGNEASLFAIR